MSRSRVAIIGAGPIGLETALAGRTLGYDVRVYERGPAVAHHIRRWSFVELFSPWSLNTSEAGLRVLDEAGLARPNPDAFPSGGEFAEQYLEPLSRALGDVIETNTSVIGVGREGLIKGDAIGAEQRRTARFRLLLRDASGKERLEEADVVIDASGVYATTAELGPEGLPIPGESEIRARVRREIPNLRDEDRANYAGKTTLVIGSGYSAATALHQLHELVIEEADTRVVWLRRSDGPPMARVENDSLPQRDRLAQFANELCTSPPPSFEVIGNAGLSRVAIDKDQVVASIDSAVGPRDVRVDQILALVGYKPNLDLTRELQVHLCYATEGPIKLAAALLGSASGGDCLAVGGFDANTLRNPEPGFFVVGHKSYGRRSDFLLKNGREQVDDVFRLIQADEKSASST